VVSPAGAVDAAEPGDFDVGAVHEGVLLAEELGVPLGAAVVGRRPDEGVLGVGDAVGEAVDRPGGGEDKGDGRLRCALLVDAGEDVYRPDAVHHQVHLGVLLAGPHRGLGGEVVDLVDGSLLLEGQPEPL
jgi:hypothetical protein